MNLIAVISTGKSLNLWGESVFGSSGSDSAKCLTGACGMETPEKPQRRRRRRGRKQGTKWAGRSGPVSLGAAPRFLWKRHFYLFFPLTFWLLFTFPGFVKPQGRNMKEDTHRALKDWWLCVCMHVCVCVYVFMYVSRWTRRAYFLSEKPIGCAQNEVLNRMLSSSGEVRATWSSGCCGSARGCAERSVQSSATLPWWGCGSGPLQELPTVSVTVCWRGDTSEGVTLAPPLGAGSRQRSSHFSASPLGWHPQGRSGDSPRALVFA